MTASRPFNPQKLKMLTKPKLAALYLEESLQAGDMEAFKIALRDVAQAKFGMAELADKTDLNRESLYRALSKQGNPRLDTLARILTAMGLQISVTVAH